MAFFPSLDSLQLPDSLTSLLGDREPEFVVPSDGGRFQCSIHAGLLRDPLQTKCGHRFCSRCLETYLAGAKTKQCPVGEEDCENVSKDEVWPDNSITRDIRKSMVYCYNKTEGCTSKVRLLALQDHLSECLFQAVACVFEARGCQERTARGKMKEHQTICPCRPVVCSLCRQHVNQDLLQNHEKDDCPEKVTGCPFGCDNKNLKRKEIDGHKATCAAHPVDCSYKPLGCPFSNKREAVRRHEKEALAQHLDLVTVKAAALEVHSLDTRHQMQMMQSSIEQLQRNLQSSGGDQHSLEAFQRMDSSLKDLKLKMVSMMEKVITVERKLPTLVERGRVQEIEQNITRIQQRIHELEQTQAREQQQRSSNSGGSVQGGAEGSGRVGQYNNLDDMADTLSGQITAHDRQLSVHDIRMAEMDLRFQLLETASYDGSLIWKVRDYGRRKRDAINARTLSLYSQPFYTNRFGYKMCGRIYLNGDGMGKTTHLSLFFVIMRGEYDPLLTWPFRQKVTLTLLDQSSEKRHLSDTFQPDPNSNSFQRPTTEMNLASGCPLFVSHVVLENRANGYLKDDTIFIRIVVDKSASSSPF